MRGGDKARYAAAMKTHNYRIVPLATSVAEEARRAAANRAVDHALVVADSPNDYPCRHCLTWAKPGERMILFPYQAVAAGRPYSESGPIVVHEAECDRYADAETYPTAFRNGRVFRAYNAARDMIDALVANGDDPEAVIEKLLENLETEFIHARSVTRGCYTFAVERQ
jgi:hypothetical protein